MATAPSVWFLCVLMADCASSLRGPLLNHPPECHIPCDDSGCSADIICTWDLKLDSKDNLAYTLHWGNYKSQATGNKAMIQRQFFTSHSELQVWVETQDQDGTVSKSETVSFNTADIIKPSPPRIESSSPEPVEIHWSSPCDQLMLEVGHCEVRHCTEAKKAWIQQEESGVSGSYTLNNPEPSTKYLFQVRCACEKSMMSNWSEVHPITSTERSPIGKLDIWRDCDMLPYSSNCILTWKKLLRTKARGHILGYNLKFYYNNGSNMALNESAVVPKFLICSEVQCYHKLSLRDVKSVSISAYNARGMSTPSHLALGNKVTATNQKAIDLELKENNLTVSWDATLIPDNVKEFVVQYKEAGSPLGEGFDWVRVNMSLSKTIVKGQFKNYTAYLVSVFPVLDNMVQLYYTEIIHLAQRIPAKVPRLKVLTYGTTDVTLLWETVLMSVHNGVTPYYQIGYGKDNVHNVSAYPQMVNRTHTLTNLNEDHEYEVWIKAVNEAGPGPNTTVLFKTRANEKIGTSLLLFLVFLGPGLLLLLFLLSYRKKKTCPFAFLYEKVPDPHNSNIIRKWKDQINDSLTWLYAPASEQHPKISIIEMVTISSQCAFNSKENHEINSDVGEDSVEEEHKKTCGFGKLQYSKMIDSDEEKNQVEEGADSCSSSEEDDTGYEQHFMPTDLDIKEIDEQERTVKSWSEE